MDFVEIESGLYCGYTEKGFLTINDDNSWKDLWKKIKSTVTPMPKCPVIDFSVRTLIAVFLGIKRSGGYGIKIKEFVENNDTTIVVYDEWSPSTRGMVTMALTQPYHIVTIPKTTKKIIFKRKES